MAVSPTHPLLAKLSQVELPHFQQPALCFQNQLHFSGKEFRNPLTLPRKIEGGEMPEFLRRMPRGGWISSKA